MVDPAIIVADPAVSTKDAACRKTWQEGPKKIPSPFAAKCVWTKCRWSKREMKAWVD